MTARARPPFRADHVGSFLRPRRLLDARERSGARRRSPRPAARSRGRRHPRGRAASRRTSGLQGITDGEFRRTYFHIDFLEQLGVERQGRHRRSRFAQRDGNVELRAAGDARHRQGPPREGHPARRLRVPESGDDAHAEGDDPVADHAALPRRPRRDQPRRVSRPRGVLRTTSPPPTATSCASLAAAGCTLRAARRHQPRLPVRREDARGRARARRRPERAAAPLRRAHQRARSRDRPPT